MSRGVVGSLLAVVAAGALGGSFGLAAGAGAAPAVPVVGVLDDAYAAPRVEVPVGGAVVFEQRGRHGHTVTADQGGFDAALAPGGKVRVRFPSPGFYRYHCVHHGAAGGRGMSGVVVVGGAAAPEGPPPKAPRPGGPATVAVPKDAPTIQQAVDAALPGDLVLVAPGIYRESVVVATPGIELRGAGRTDVVLDGNGVRDTGVLVAADGVSVRNLTARRFRTSGFVWWGVKGFRGSYLSAAGNGSYGVRAFGSKAGVLDRVYAVGHPDAGISVAACASCDTVVADALAERNAVGFLAANTSGGVTLARSEARANGAGIVAAPFGSMPGPRSGGMLIAGNRVHGNGDPSRPVSTSGRPSASGPEADARWLPAGGAGILIAGASDVRVERNLVEGNRSYGLLVSPSVHPFQFGRDSRVRTNTATGNGRADLALAAPAGSGVCFSGNRFGNGLPPGLQVFSRCGSPLAKLGGAGDLGVAADWLARLARMAKLGTAARPPVPDTSSGAGVPQPSMPDAASAPSQPATGAAIGPEGADPAGAALPRPSTPSLRGPAEASALGITLASPAAAMLGLYVYLLPVALYAAWVSVAFWDLAGREDLGDPARVGLAALVLGLPFLGPLGYLILAAKRLPTALRLALTFGGLGLYLLLAAISFALGRA